MKSKKNNSIQPACKKQGENAVISSAKSLPDSERELFIYRQSIKALHRTIDALCANLAVNLGKQTSSNTWQLKLKGLDITGNREKYTVFGHYEDGTLVINVEEKSS